MHKFFLSADIEEIVQRLGDNAELLSGKTILLTGGCGFLGRCLSAVVDQLNDGFVNVPIQLIVLDNFITARDTNLAENWSPYHRIVEHDVIEPFMPEEGIDFIIHAAGIASPYYYREYPLETLEVAISGTRNMLRLAKEKNARFTFFSSSEIYGDPDPKHVPMPESYRGNVASQGPRACYDESKRVGETICYIYHTKEGTHTNIIRPFNVFGPGMQENDYRVLPNFANRIKAGLPLNVYGDGSQTRTFCYITDAIVGFFLVILRGKPGATYNIGNPKPELSILDLVKRIQKVSETRITYNLMKYPDSYPDDEPMRRSPDIRKAWKELGFEPEIDIDTGLKRFLSWADSIYTGEQAQF